MDSRKVGILGGGQLGRMMVEAAHRLNIQTVILDAPGAPAKQINALHEHVNGSFSNAESIRALAKECDVITYEIEHIDTKVLEEIDGQVELQPSWKTVRVIQDKYLQKAHLIEAGADTAESLPVESTAESLADVGNKLGYPYMLKSRTLAYDGRGNYVVKDASAIPGALEALKDRPLYAEKWARFVKELAVMVVRTKDGEVISYPTVETVHEDNICKLVYAPARVPEGIREQARRLAEKAVKSFWGAGIFGVEMFLLEDGSLLINELAPRPHNSGHYTIEACPTSQYEAHIRAITGLPLLQHSTALATPSTNAIMLNLLGPSTLKIAREALSVKGATVHLYGKGEAKPGRKMGHLTVIAGSMSEAEYQIAPLIEMFDKEKTGSSSVVAGEAPATKEKKPVVAVIMGSDSDLPVMKAGAEILKKFGVDFEVTIVSAHRTPDRMNTFAKEARARGLKAIIAGAGGAAHLPGMVAAMCTLPVIGVPVKGSVLDGVDSLHSIVQMPRGVPVATVAINNSTNAALLALRIISAEDSPLGRDLRTKLQQYVEDMEAEVNVKIEKLEVGGWEDYVVKK
ncbi:Similar to Phosphoribosylaminoimidazole carboxylase; acc. no. Q92210 [Pyronema omphalodes CBS 100304]|uniref:Phosphoribosylaminoimidazole carboxylase n=1 Tax=Pyronema omphalodes (strain CBS 100304) TaxID=1076935 RepID=U4LJR5_PYROM|nr:Similar to Phosphoribosylaminoimidazole carboxylase; acc. no. Q92210 [Pyronema omphalodes CBS 100304]